MSADASPVRLSVLGPPDLLVTSLVAGLTASGVEATRIPLHEAQAGSHTFPTGGPGVLLVDIDVLNPVRVVAQAVRAGMIVLAIGSEGYRERAAAAIASGAVGWIRKTSSLDLLAETVRAAARGRMQMSAEMRAAWLAEHRLASDTARAGLDRLEQLTPREREVLGHLANGQRAAEIADLLFVSITTVRTHIRAVLVKLGVNSQQQAVDVYRETSQRLTRLLGSASGQ